MSTNLLRALIAFLVIVVLVVGFFFFVAPVRVDADMNRVLADRAVRPSARARALHKTLTIADLHADSLLWGRDLLARSTRGHVDVPRLIEGNVALQVFAAVTKSPKGQNIQGNDDSTDSITALAVINRWPLAALSSLKERALYQARRLHESAAASGGKLTVIETAAGLAGYLARRKTDPSITAGLLAIEGSHVLEGDPANVDALFDAGYRMLGPAHFFDNEMAGSAHGMRKGGLTDKGKAMVRRMEAKHMLVDLAHSSTKTIDDVLAMATRPVVVSHTGVKGTCNNVRNLSDAQLVGVAKTGGVVGIGYWHTAICGKDPKAIARAIRHAVRHAGIDHVGLGSDYDGAITAPFDTSEISAVTDALIAQGFADADIAKVMGGNVVRLLSTTLP